MKAGLAVLVLISILMSAPAFGQALSPKKDFDDWNFYIAPYFYVIHLSGTAATYHPVDLRFDPFTDGLDWGILGLIQVKKARWAFGVDLSYSELSREYCSEDLEDTDCEADLKNTVKVGEHEFFVGYQFNESMPASDVILGLRYVNHDITVEPKSGTDDTSMSFGETFYVPFIGIRYFGPISDESRWSPLLRGDVGPSTSGVKLNWRFSLGLSYLFAKHFDLSFQYKWKHDECVKGEIGDSDYYSYSATEHGPIAGIGIRF